MKLILDQVTININHKTICNDLSLTMSPGEIWAILGPNGIGKTTFLRALMGLHKIARGEIYLDDRPLKSLNTKTIAKHLGFLLQNQEYTFANTVTETIATGAYAKDLKTVETLEQIKKILKQLHLSDLANKSVLQLSGGEKRLVDFATILLQAPQCYLLDEPTNHLDLKHQQLLLSLSRELAHQGNSIVMSTHDINIASQHSDNILLFFGNGVTSHGDTQTLLEQNTLETLYQCRIKKINHEEKHYWLAETNL